MSNEQTELNTTEQKKQIIVIDASQLNTLQSCDMMMRYQYLLNLRPAQKAEALEKGSLGHVILEAYYRAKRLKSLGKMSLSLAEIVDKSCQVGAIVAPTLQMDMAVSMNIISNCRDYMLYYNSDGWEPLFIEMGFSKVIYEDEDFVFVYEGKVDLVTEVAGSNMPDAIVDHKFTSRSKNPHPLNNQFIGYCWALDKRTVVKNEIGFQTSYGPKDRFKRFVISYNLANIEEWQQNTIGWIKRFILSYHMNQYLMNFTSCDKWSGCQFTELCYCTPDAREWKMETKYVKGEKWSPVKRSVDQDVNPFLILEGMNDIPEPANADTIA